MSTLAFDLRQPQLVAAQLAEVNRRLAGEREVDPATRELVRALADSLSELDAEATGQDPYLLIEIEKAQLRALRALDQDVPLAERRAIRLAIESMRALFTRMAEQAPVSEERPAKEIAQWLAVRLDVPQREIAQLLGVNPRTFSRWVSEQEPHAPSGDDARRLRVVAQLAAQLRFALTGPGVISWLKRPNASLGAPPVHVLDDPGAAGRLLQLARGARVSGAD
jgi:DNA-binding transcriptional regulator YiaG